MTAIKETLKYFLLKAFDIREGEYRRALLMQLYIFLLITTLLIVKPTVYALFLSKFGAEILPWAFLAVAFVAAFVSTLYARSLRKATLLRVSIITLVLAVLTLLIFGFLLIGNVWEAGVIFLFYLWVALFGVLTSSQFWILANIIFNPREAKRLFGFIGAGAIAGGIFGGYLTSLLTQFFSTEILLFIAALLLAGCIPIVWQLWRNIIPEMPDPLRQKRKDLSVSQHPLKMIRSSRHLTYLASIIGVSVIVAKLVDYQFSAIASARFPDPDELAAFLGFWFSTLNLVSLFIQLFLTRRVVGRFGVGTSLFFLPGGIMIGAFLMLFLPELWVAVFIKIADGSLKQSINKAAVELLALPIPQEIKSQTKTFIDVFVDSIATGIGGLILIFLISGLELSTRFISLMILAVLGLWIFFVWKIRGEYIKAFQEKIRQNQGGSQQKKLDLTKESVIGGMRKALIEGTENQKIFILNKLRGNQYPSLFEPIQNLLKDASPKVRAAAIRNLYFYRASPIPDLIKPLTDAQEENVKVAAFEYLIHFSLAEEVPALMETHFNHADFRIRGSALISLCTEAARNSQLQKVFGIEKRIHQLLEELHLIKDPDELKHTKISVLKALAKSPLPPFTLFIKEALHDTDLDIQKQAILTAGQSLEPFWIEQVLPLLNQDLVQQEAQMALSMYGVGLFSHLPSSLFTDEKYGSLLKRLPAVFERIGSQQSVSLLFELLEQSDLAVQMNALKSLNQLKIQFPKLHFDERAFIPRISEEAHTFLESLSVLYAQNYLSKEAGKKGEEEVLEARKSLITLLERRLDGRLERIFRLLGLKYPPEDMISVYEGIQKGTQEQRSLSIEFLDNILENKLKSLLMPIIETAMLDLDSRKAVEQLNLKIPDEKTCFRVLLGRQDNRLKMAVFYLITQLKNPDFVELVTPFLDDKNPQIRDFARKAVDSIE